MHSGDRPGRSPSQSPWRLTTLDSGVRIVTEAMPSVRSVSLGFWIGTGSRAESDAEAGLSPPDRASAVQGDREVRVARDRPDLRRDGRRAQRRHRQGDDVGLRPGDRRAPARCVRRDGRHGVPPGAERRRVRARRDPRGDRDVRGRSPGEGVRRARRGGVRRAPAGPRDHRPRSGDRRDPCRRDRALSRRALRAGEHRDRGGRRDRPRRARSSLRPTAYPRRPAAQPRTHRTPRRRPVRPDGASSARTPSSTTSASADRRSRATTTAASLCACSTRSSAAPPPRGCSRRSASVAASPTPCTPSAARTSDTGQVGLYVGTRAENLSEALAVVGTELERLRERAATDEELDRAKENLKGRVVLALESTGARMNRLGSEVLAGAPLLSLDEVVARIDAVSVQDLQDARRRALGPRAPVGCRDRARRATLRRGARRARARTGLARGGSLIRVVVAGAAGRMGQTVCAAVAGRRGHGAGRAR